MNNELLPCPKCGSTNVKVSGDDFDADIVCNNCGLLTLRCHGTSSAIKFWNSRKNINTWEYIDDKSYALANPTVTEQLKQLLTVTWDGNLISKDARNILHKKYLINRCNGYNFINEDGIKLLIELGELKS